MLSLTLYWPVCLLFGLRTHFFPFWVHWCSLLQKFLNSPRPMGDRHRAPSVKLVSVPDSAVSVRRLLGAPHLMTSPSKSQAGEEEQTELESLLDRYEYRRSQVSLECHCHSFCLQPRIDSSQEAPFQFFSLYFSGSSLELTLACLCCIPPDLLSPLQLKAELERKRRLLAKIQEEQANYL